MGNCIAFDKQSDDTYFTQIRRKSKPCKTLQLGSANSLNIVPCKEGVLRATLIPSL